VSNEEHKEKRKEVSEFFVLNTKYTRPPFFAPAKNALRSPGEEGLGVSMFMPLANEDE